MNEFTMVIPTYWGRADVSNIDKKIVFDHPTPLHQKGTLGRLLKSLELFAEFPGRIVIISVANDPALTAEVENKVNSIIAPYQSRFEIVHLTQSGLQIIKSRLEQKGVSRQGLELLNLNNYAAVRNMCSLAGILNATPYTIFIDDDEVFKDNRFFEKIAENMGRELAGEKIEALAGYYLQPKSYRLDERTVPGWRVSHWNNTVAMNQAFDQIIGQPPCLKATPFVFGGNMTLSLEVLKKVPFDPNITRGEDIDFLINLRINNITFYLDRELAIIHLPPASFQPAWKKFREDAVRFLYERKKLRDHPRLRLEDFQPYPGRFLDNDLEERIMVTSQRLSTEYSIENDEAGILKCMEIYEMAQNDPYKDFDTKSWLETLCTNWQELSCKAEGMGIPEKE
ncbi:MAG: hypothetical protein JW860_06860 [Sedimentisphaerales bacterium]|nr:hypothetical protein [Sedimentisphaerales bacterium]